MPIRASLFLTAILALCYPLQALADYYDHDAHIWSVVNFNGRIDDRWSANLEIQNRFMENASAYGQRLIRPSVTYQLNPVYSLTAGYGHVMTNSSTTRAFDENRLWQQVGYRMYKNDYGIALSGRTRLEERLVETGDDLGWRLRQYVRLEAPFEAHGKTKFLLWNETFYGFNRTDWGQRNDFDQMRNFVGFMVPLHERLSLDAGYMNQVVFKSNVDDRMNHTFATAVTFKF